MKTDRHLPSPLAMDRLAQLLSHAEHRVTHRGEDLHQRLRERIESQQEAILAEADEDVAELAALLTYVADRPR